MAKSRYRSPRRPARSSSEARPRFRLRFRVPLLGASLVVAIAGAELSLRVHTCWVAGSLRPLFSPVVANHPIERGDERRNHALIPGEPFVATGYPPGSEFVVYGQISAQGLNDDEVPEPKPAGERRVLVLGDSFVEARQVPRSENFCRQLERALNDGASSRVRVINGGVSSYSPILERIYYDELRRFQPDVVLLVLFANDVFDDIRYSDLAKYNADGDPISVPTGVPWMRVRKREGSSGVDGADELLRFGRTVGTLDGWAGRSYLGARIAGLELSKQIAQAKAGALPKNDELFALEDDRDLQRDQAMGWSLVNQHIASLRRATDRDHARLLLTVSPIAAQVSGASSYDHFFFSGRPTEADEENVHLIATSLDVPFVDLLTPLRKAGGGLYYPNDGHWTAAGHHVVASALHCPVARGLGLSCAAASR